MSYDEQQGNIKIPPMNSEGNVKFEINEFGEIVRKDYAFRSAKKSPDQPLPTNRSAGMVYFLSFITLGIYGIVLSFNMAGETNISCADDGKHTPGFWKAVLLSLITFGIYWLVWNYKWCNREADFLRKNGRSSIITGGEWETMQFVMLILSMIPMLCIMIGMVGNVDLITRIVQLINLGIALRVLSKILAQHNAVNKFYNLRRFPSKG